MRNAVKKPSKKTPCLPQKKQEPGEQIQIFYQGKLLLASEVHPIKQLERKKYQIAPLKLLLLNYFREHCGKDFLKNCKNFKLIPAINIPKITIKNEKQKITIGKLNIGTTTMYLTQVEKNVNVTHGETFIISRYNVLLNRRFNYTDEEEAEASEESDN